MAYDLAAQYRRVVAELRASRKAHDALVALHDAYDSTRDQFAVRGRLFRILRDWDATPKAVLDHQPEPSKETT
jgi:hypothetical protein